MDHPDKKRAQPSTSESAANPPAKRHQPMTHQPAMSSAQAAGQQSAVASGHPMAMATAAAASSTSSMSAGMAAAAFSAFWRSSPGQRCPSDPLSIVLSFLDGCDFAAASRVCRHWCRTAELPSAWPDHEFSVERLISDLIEHENCWHQSRSVTADADHLSADALQRAAQSPKWRRLIELCLYSFTVPEVVMSSALLRQVAQLPQLRSLRLEFPPRLRLSDVAASFTAMAPRLLAFSCSSAIICADVQSRLHLLANLRVLVLQDIEGWYLQQRPLHQLEYLEVNFYLQKGRDLPLAIRRLSVQHRLRHATLSFSPAFLTLDLTPLVAELDGEDRGLAPAALSSIRLLCDLSRESRSALLSLPNLTRLHWDGEIDDHGVYDDPPPPLPTPPLLRQYLDYSGPALLLQRLRANVRVSPLRELHVSDTPPSVARLIPLLPSLRVFGITRPQSSTLSLPLLQSLASLPLLSELAVRQDWRKAETFRLTVETLRCMAESRTWRLIRLVGRSNRPRLILPAGVDAHLAERLADLRAQMEGPRALVYRLVVDSAQGKVTWQKTAM